MERNHGNLTKRHKGYVKLIIINVVFFGIFIAGLLWERSFSGLQYSGVFFFFVIAVIPYSIWYGAYSYRVTEQIVLPNLLLGLFGLTFIPVFVVLSVISSIVTKLITKAYGKRKNALPPAQPPEDQ